jgi:hypothetical protein
MSELVRDHRLELAGVRPVSARIGSNTTGRNRPITAGTDTSRHSQYLTTREMPSRCCSLGIVHEWSGQGGEVATAETAPGTDSRTQS